VPQHGGVGCIELIEVARQMVGKLAWKRHFGELLL
jgi:hypothetical protein